MTWGAATASPPASGGPRSRRLRLQEERPGWRDLRLRVVFEEVFKGCTSCTLQHQRIPDETSHLNAHEPLFVHLTSTNSQRYANDMQVPQAVSCTVEFCPKSHVAECQMNIQLQHGSAHHRFSHLVDQRATPGERSFGDNHRPTLRLPSQSNACCSITPSSWHTTICIPRIC